MCRKYELAIMKYSLHSNIKEFPMLKSPIPT